MNPTRAGTIRQSGTPPWPRGGAPSSNSRPSTESFCTRPPACCSVFPRAALTARRCPCLHYRLLECGGVLYASLLQRFVDLRFGKSGIRPKDYLLTQLLLSLDFRLPQFFPVLATVDVAEPELGRQTVALAIEQQQRVIAGRFEVAVVGAVLLLAVNRNPGRIHVQNNPLRGIQG